MKLKKNIFHRLGWFIGSLASVTSMTTAAAQYDLVINGGRVMDPETQRDGIANIGIKNGKIISIGTQIMSADKTIDANGLVVAPGFIDTHLHGMDPFAVKMALRDGVTTGLDLEAGAANIDQWYAAHKNRWQINYGVTASHIFARMQVHDPEVNLDKPIDFPKAKAYLNQAAKDGVAGWASSISSPAQLKSITQQLDRELQQGALGVGIGLAYVAKGATSQEVFEVQKIAAKYDRLASVHTRYHLNGRPPTEAAIGFDEVFTNAALLKASLLIAHNNDYGWQEIEQKLQLARSQGFNMWSEYYPYKAGSTVISADFLRPETWREKFGYRYQETVFDPQQNKFLNQTEYQQLCQRNPGHTVVVFMPKRSQWLPQWLSVPHMTVASDGMAGVGENGQLLAWSADYSAYRGHPRSAGTRAKVLRLARENNIPLMHTLSQLSYWSAKHLGDAGITAMKYRGRIQPGMIADITLFDPKTVSDKADYKADSNGLPSTGIPWVIVNGVVVVQQSKALKGVNPGQAIRYPVNGDKNR